MNSDMNDSAIYEHFSAYGLAERGNVAQRLQQLSESELTQFFTIYMTQAKQRFLAYRAPAGNADIYPDSWDSRVSLETVKQLAIYANRIYVHDPLLELAHGWQSLDFNIPLRMQYASREETRTQYLLHIAKAIEEMVALRPLAEAQVVYFTPTFLIQGHRDSRDIYSDTFYGSAGSAERLLGREKSFELPPSFAKYIRDHFHVVPARQERGKAILLPDQPLGPTRTIALYFDGDPSPTIQLLADIQPFQQDELHLRLRYSLDEEPPEELTFWNWIEGTRRQVIRERLERLEQDIDVAATAQAKFLTSLPTSKDLVQLSTAGEKGRDTDVLTALLRLDLPYFEQASFTSIAKARRDEIAFEEFRIALNKAFREINNLSSPREVQERIDEIRRDLLLVPIGKIDRRIKNHGRTLIPGAAVAAGSLLATILLQGTPLFAAGTLLGGLAFGGTALASAYRARQADLAQIKELPSFFYWELIHQTPQHGRQFWQKMSRKRL